ncbi:DUF4349 domain-containing protein [Halalkalibacter kiskunsagensis]|uniref:DUF4349 domain-containing protein n=1 Tax=Halalkalibacter kiskunsagensis TaxID=1548599 RepID=A0ABV6KHL2_9BACI
MNMKVILSTLFLLFLLLACSSQEQEAIQMDQAVYEQRDMAKTEENASIERADVESEILEPLPFRGESVEERMVIYQGYITIEVKDYVKAKDEIHAKIMELGGYVVESHYNEDAKGHLFGSIVLRIPKQDFQPFFDHFGNSDVKILEQHTHGSDVTEEFVDLESRLKAKRVVEERLLSFMDNADNTENLLKISNDLAKVQEEIEQMTGRKQYFENQVDFSTVTITIQENAIIGSTLQGDDLNTWERSKKLFIDTINVLITAASAIIVFLIGLSPIGLPIVILIGLTIYIKRNGKKNKEER